MKNKIVIILISCLIFAVCVDLFLIFNNSERRKNIIDDENNNSSTSSNYDSYNCTINKSILITPANEDDNKEIKIPFYDFNGGVNIKYSENDDNYLINHKENYKFLYDAEYYVAITKSTFKDHDYEKDDENLTLKLDYDESVELDQIDNYLKQLENEGYSCQSYKEN